MGTKSYTLFKEESQQLTQQLCAQIQPHSDTNIIGKWIVSVITLGTILLASVIKSKLETGKWQNRFFEKAGEKEIQDFDEAALHSQTNSTKT